MPDHDPFAPKQTHTVTRAYYQVVEVETGKHTITPEGVDLIEITFKRGGAKFNVLANLVETKVEVK